MTDRPLRVYQVAAVFSEMGGSCDAMVAAGTATEAAHQFSLSPSTLRERGGIMSGPPSNPYERKAYEWAVENPGRVILTRQWAPGGWKPWGAAQDRTIAHREVQLERKRENRRLTLELRERDAAEAAERRRVHWDRYQREREADRAAVEHLEAHTELLEDVGLAGLVTNGDGNVTLPVETLVGLLRRLA